MRARMTVDVAAYINRVIDEKVARAKAALETGDTGFRGDALYFTATDVERDVREAMRLDLQKAAGTFVGRMRISAGSTMLDQVRRALQRREAEGELESHNYGKRHISGQRYRPAGTPLSKAEEGTLALPREEKRRRANVRHFAGPDGSACCGAKIRGKGGWRGGRWRAGPVTDSTQVTCKRCLSLLAHGQVEDRAAERKVYDQLVKEQG